MKSAANEERELAKTDSADSEESDSDFDDDEFMKSFRERRVAELKVFFLFVDIISSKDSICFLWNANLLWDFVVPSFSNVRLLPTPRFLTVNLDTRATFANVRSRFQLNCSQVHGI